MEILETLLDIGIDILDGFALLYLCRSMLKECRIKRAEVYYLFVLPLTAVIFAYNHYFPTVWGMLVTELFMLATVLALFRDKMRYRILWFCVALVLPFAMDLTVSKAILENCLHRSSYELMKQGGALVFYLYALTTRFVILGIDVFIAHRRLSATLTEKDWLNFAIIPVLSFVANMLVLSESMWGSLGQVPAVVIGVLILVINVFAYRQLLHVSENAYALAQEKAQARIEAYKVEQYHRLIQQHDATRGWKHDMKNHLLTASSMLESGHIDDAKAYLEGAADRLERDTFVIQSGNTALDGILNAKIEEATAAGCKVSLRLELPARLMDEIDCCTVVGNLWDNAIRANSVLPQNVRSIQFTIGPAGNFCRIRCENPLPPAGALPPKNDGQEHGIGLRQVEAVAHRYNGVYEATQDNNIWQADVHTPLTAVEGWSRMYAYDL